MSTRSRFVVFFLAVFALASHSTSLQAVPPLGDVDGDGDVDNSDLAIIAGNNGLVGGSISDGDVDQDFDVDQGDFFLASSEFLPSGFGGFAGLLTPDLNPARLLYNPTSGQVLLDQTNAPGGAISTFVLGSSSAFTAPGTANFPFGGVLLEDVSSVIAQSDPLSYSPAPGFPSNPHDLGSVLPSGLDGAGLSALLSTAVYVGLAGTGVREFALVVLPEPASLALCFVAIVSVGWRRR